MRKILLAIIVVLSLYDLATAQLVNLIFGPRDGDNAGILHAYDNATADVDVWIRTNSPYINIIAMHLPLSSNDQYVRSDSRHGHLLYYPLSEWEEAEFLPPNEDSENEGYTNQSILAICSHNEDCNDFLHTEGEWWKIATFSMTTIDNGLGDPVYCDAFVEGYHPMWRDMVLEDYFVGELDLEECEVEFACLQLIDYICAYYVVGDFNGSGVFNLADVVAAYSKLKTGSPDPAMTCECPAGSGNEWPLAADLNNSCDFNLADIVDGFSKLKFGSPELIPCEYCPPPGWEP